MKSSCLSQNEDLFFALRGGGFGFGVVVSLSVRTYPLPSYFGWMVGSVVARSREAAREMLRGFLDFTKNSLLGQNSYWGESVFFEPVGEGGYRAVNMMFPWKLNYKVVKLDFTP